ncbi:methyltransferase [Treponema sp. TIM-1]|uniref:methyltransferase n=1 Tax=Treponema sp. TIM-1 TaxID=2898417 RepID=UPI00397F8712
MDTIRAVDAKFEAQKICFAPISFQAVRALRELGVLRKISDAGDTGLTREEAAAASGLPIYGVGVLIEMALALGVLKLRADTADGPPEEEKFILGKIGWFLLEDDMTIANFNFVNDVCYQGAFKLKESVQEGKPRGLSIFGDRWATIYDALASLPHRARESWFNFDHFYSDIAFPEALPLVFETKPRRLFDIGGNTAKWAIACCAYDQDVAVTIIDLPEQIAVAQKNAAAFGTRISCYPGNILDAGTVLPPGAEVIWMSQFLDCFSPEQIGIIMGKIRAAVSPDTDVYVLEPLLDKQRFEASAYSLRAISLYFTCMANGSSKMYSFAVLNSAVENAGFKLQSARHDLGSNNYSLLRYRKIP